MVTNRKTILKLPKQTIYQRAILTNLTYLFHYVEPEWGQKIFSIFFFIYWMYVQWRLRGYTDKTVNLKILQISRNFWYSVDDKSATAMWNSMMLYLLEELPSSPSSNFKRTTMILFYLVYIDWISSWYFLNIKAIDKFKSDIFYYAHHSDDSIWSHNFFKFLVKMRKFSEVSKRTFRSATITLQKLFGVWK